MLGGANSMAESLERRIATALSDETISSAALSELLQKTDAAVIAADATAEEERAKALDPTLSPDPKDARAAMEDAAFAANRLRNLLPRLKKHLQHMQYVEAHDRWLKSYRVVK